MKLTEKFGKLINDYTRLNKEAWESKYGMVSVEELLLIAVRERDKEVLDHDVVRLETYEEESGWDNRGENVKQRMEKTL